MTTIEGTGRGDRRQVVIYGAVTAAVGVIMVLVCLIIDARVVSLPTPRRVLLEFFLGFGGTLISLGIAGIIISFPDWTRYFQERLAETVVQRPYLSRLSKAELISLQTDTLKAYFENDDIDREGSFLEFFHSRLSQLIASPFRTDLNCTINLSSLPDGRQRMTEEIAWRCRSVGSSIQESIAWIPEDHEFDEIEDVQVYLQRPIAGGGEVMTSSVRSGAGTGKVYDFDELQRSHRAGLGFRVMLEDYRAVDGLRVKIKTRYVQQPFRFLGWRMAHPTRGVSLTVHYPDRLRPHYELFGIDQDEVDIVDGDGLFQVRAAGWVLPDAGIAFQFLPREPDRR